MRVFVFYMNISIFLATSPSRYVEPVYLALITELSD